MNGLNQVRAAVLEALQAAGLQTLPRMETGERKDWGGPVAVVGVAQAAGKAMGLGNYLGTVYDSGTGTEREVYGRLLEIAVSVDIYAPGGAADCEAAMETAAEALLDGLPAGLRLKGIQWGEAKWDGDSRLYVRRGKAEYDAQFTAAASPETGELLDFQLKGVVRQ